MRWQQPLSYQSCRYSPCQLKCRSELQVSHAPDVSQGKASPQGCRLIPPDLTPFSEQSITEVTPSTVAPAYAAFRVIYRIVSALMTSLTYLKSILQLPSYLFTYLTASYFNMSASPPAGHPPIDWSNWAPAGEDDGKIPNSQNQNNKSDMTSSFPMSYAQRPRKPSHSSPQWKRNHQSHGCRHTHPFHQP